MAADSRDPITGAYIFSDTGAPDIGVDPTLVSAQANDVGTRIIRADLAALNAYEYKRRGLEGYASDTGVSYVHDGTGWVQAGPGAWTNVTSLGSGWTATPGYAPQVRRDGLTVFIRGAVTITSGSFANMLTVPAGFRPNGSRWVGQSHGSASGATGMLLIDAGGLLQIPTSYRSGTGASGTAFPLSGSWTLD